MTRAVIYYILNNMIKFIIKHIILDIIYFPIWWYSKGLHYILRWAKNSLANSEQILALKIWLKSMFKPMFQDYSREGRIVSFFMRTIILAFKLIILIFWILGLGSTILTWLTLPIAIIIIIFLTFK